MMMAAAAVATLAQLLLLYPLLQVNFCVSFLLVGSCKLTTACVTAEGLFAGVRPDVGGEVVRSRERSHADAALERFLSRVDANVTRQLIRPRESSVAIFNRARVRTLVNGRFAWAIWIFARLHGD